MSSAGSIDDARLDSLYRAVVESAVDPVIVIDAGGIILTTNDATSALFGYSREEMLGRGVSMLMSEPHRSQHDSYVERYLAHGEARIIGIGRDVEAQRADGTIFPVSLAVSEVIQGGEPIFAGVLHDLTAREEAREKLRAANATLEARVKERTDELHASMMELARSNRDLEQFAYIASHDLQAPLRNVRQGLELLDDHLTESYGSSFDDEAEELRDLIVAAVHRMEDLIHGLLSYSKVQRSVHRGVGPAVDLNTVVEEVIADLGGELELAEVDVTFDDLPTVAGDAFQLRQLVANLVQNAAKYRAEGRAPTVHLRAEMVEGQWAVSVTDNGIGIDAGQHERIFELFRRAHPGYSGVGLGLAICQRIVESHGGEIWVESEPDAGATFTFTLPLVEDR